MGQPLTIDIPTELLEMLGTEDEARQEAKTTLILDLVRRGKVLGLALRNFSKSR